MDKKSAQRPRRKAPSHPRIDWDGFIRNLLQRTDIACDLLLCYLPPAYLQVYNLDTLTLVSETLPPQPPHTHVQQMDMVYQLTTYDGKGHLLVHIEHQSTRQKMIAWRMRQYDTGLTERYLHSPEGNGRLADVFSLVLYNGGNPWQPKQDYRQLLPTEPMRQLAMQRKEPWKLVNLRQMSDNELDKLRSLSPVLMVLRDLAHVDLADILTPLESRLRGSKLSEEERDLIRNFIFRYGNTKRYAELKQTIETLKQQPKGDYFMSVADMLIEEGFERGVEKGREEMRIAAANFLKSGISPEIVMNCTGIKQEELIKLMMNSRE